MNFPVNLKNLRKRYNYSQERLAEKLNRSKSAVSNWENGVNNPDFDSLIIMRELFDTDIDTLLFGETDGEFSKTEYLEILNEPQVNYGLPLTTEGVLERMQRQIVEIESRLAQLEKDRNTEE